MDSSSPWIVTAFHTFTINDGDVDNGGKGLDC